MESHIEKLLELIDEFVNWEEKNWKDKRDAVLKNISDEDKASLEEFCSWFETSVE